jgi:hypothetical protein
MAKGPDEKLLDLKRKLNGIIEEQTKQIYLDLACMPKSSLRHFAMQRPQSLYFIVIQQSVPIRHLHHVEEHISGYLKEISHPSNSSLRQLQPIGEP